MEFIDGMFQLIFSVTGEYSGENPPALAVFSASSAVVGIIVVVLDWLLVMSGKESALNLAHRGANSIWLIMLWGMGAGLGGFLGAGFGILQLNRVACITTSVAWPLILPRLVKTISIESGEDSEDEEEEE